MLDFLAPASFDVVLTLILLESSVMLSVLVTAQLVLAAYTVTTDVISS